MQIFIAIIKMKSEKLKIYYCINNKNHNQQKIYFEQL